MLHLVKQNQKLHEPVITESSEYDSDEEFKLFSDEEEVTIINEMENLLNVALVAQVAVAETLVETDNEIQQEIELLAFTGRFKANGQPCLFVERKSGGLNIHIDRMHSREELTRQT